MPADVSTASPADPPVGHGGQSRGQNGKSKTRAISRMCGVTSCDKRTPSSSGKAKEHRELMPPLAWEKCVMDRLRCLPPVNNLDVSSHEISGADTTKSQAASMGVRDSAASVCRMTQLDRPDPTATTFAAKPCLNLVDEFAFSESSPQPTDRVRARGYECPSSRRSKSGLFLFRWQSPPDNH